MLSIQPTHTQKCTPNLLPARINHNGPINNTDRFFKPTKDDDAKSHAYLRGRHLHGITLPLPSNYTGAVLRVTEKTLPPKQQQTLQQHIDDDDDAEQEEEIKEDVFIAEQVGEFDEVVIWGHGEKVDEGRDAFVRGVREWVGFAEGMHCDSDDEEKAGKTAGK